MSSPHLKFKEVTNDTMIKMLLENGCVFTEKFLRGRNQFELILMVCVLGMDIPLDCCDHLDENDYITIGALFGLRITSEMVWSRVVDPNIREIRCTIKNGSRYAKTLYEKWMKDPISHKTELLRVLPGFDKASAFELDINEYNLLERYVRNYIKYLNFKGYKFENI